MEEFRDIPGYEGLYSVSNYGNVWSHIKSRLLKPSLNATGYLHVALYNQGKKFYRVHQLVAIAFLGHERDGTLRVVVDHIDNDKLNNLVSNLQLTTSRHNLSKDKVRKYDLPTGVYTSNNKKFRSSIHINNSKLYLGTFDTPEEASEAYQSALDKSAQ